MLNLDLIQPIDVEDPVEVPDWGQIPPNIIDDAVTRGIYAYNTGGEGYALSSYGEELKRMIAQRTHRSQDAADLLAFLHRQVLADHSLISDYCSKEVKLELECM